MQILDVEKTGQNIKRIMSEKNITAKDVQKILGLTTTHAIYRWRRGETTPTIDNLVILSHVFDIPIDSIVVKKEVKDGERK